MYHYATISTERHRMVSPPNSARPTPRMPPIARKHRPTTGITRKKKGRRKAQPPHRASRRGYYGLTLRGHARHMERRAPAANAVAAASLDAWVTRRPNPLPLWRAEILVCGKSGRVGRDYAGSPKTLQLFLIPATQILPRLAQSAERPNYLVQHAGFNCSEGVNFALESWIARACVRVSRTVYAST
ncbi:hypothetical protein DFH07DRAFT_34632 [Mycena maculata]|uniref:Uncharacterized protein n=1 Tax=Mycena maculata TaxID=230809 RepID=A0AAD7IIJ4_9AGAR|nr:hypothetical protein DFH07DRAFT_34632 [Mycena maculata]